MQNAGQLKIYSGGILWKKQGGGKAIEVDKADIMGVTWMKVPRTNQLGVRIKDGLFYKFTGFRDQVTILTLSLSLSLSLKMYINLMKLGSASSDFSSIVLLQVVFFIFRPTCFEQ